MTYVAVPKGVDEDGDVQPIGATVANTNALRTFGQEDFNLSEILKQLKIINRHLELLTEVKFEDHNLER
jgi:hypothetical protein